MISQKVLKSINFQIRGIILGFFCLSQVAALGQTAVVSAFNEPSGTNGSISYSVGQSFTLTGSGNDGTIINGIQQPFTIYTLGVIDENIGADISVFPNPTSKELVLKTEKAETGSMSYFLYDLNGKLIQTLPVTGSETLIDMNNMNAATYLLEVNHKGKSIKSFRIIKN